MGIGCWKPCDRDSDSLKLSRKNGLADTSKNDQLQYVGGSVLCAAADVRHLWLKVLVKCFTCLREGDINPETRALLNITVNLLGE